jgi:hypothetical protein
LNRKSSRFSVNSTLRKLAIALGRPASAPTTSTKRIDSGGKNTPPAIPARIKAPAAITSSRFAAGPATDIQAARRG